MSKDNTIKQCVLICESITSNYQTSSVFNKIAGNPAIELCCSWLTDHGIKDIFLFYSKSKDQVQNFHHQHSKTGKNDVKMHLNYIKPEQLKNFGDILREVQFRNIISQDFIILFADTVCNLNLTKAISTHFKRKAQLKSVVLTSILRDNSFDGKVHITSSETGQILQMDEDNGSKFVLNGQRINLKKTNVQFRRDLTHCDIYLCTVDVFKSFKQNYEYATMFDFINGMLTSQVYQEKILGHILDNSQQCYRINKAKDYYLAYIHYISNYFYPYTMSSPSSHRQKQQGSLYSVKNFNKVIANSVAVPRSTHVSNTCFIGEGCAIGHDIQIEKTIIANGCQVSNKSILKNCIILEGCVIGQKAKFDNCLIEKVNETQQIIRFRVFPKYEAQIVTQPLFEQTPPPQQNTFEQQLQQILQDDPQLEIVAELNSIRFHHNKTLQQFTKQMIRILAPKGVKGVQEFCQNWGEILFKINDKQPMLLDSLYYACTNIVDYEKAFHVFLQLFFQAQLIKQFTILQWYEEAAKKYPDSQTLQKCNNFIQKLRQKSEQQASGSEDDADSEKSNKSQSNSNKS